MTVETATAEAPTKDIVLTIQGRTFRKSQTTTVAQDAFVMKRMREFGLVEMAASFNPQKDDLNVFSEKLLLEAFETGQLFEILGGVLVEDGVKWSKKVALANAEFFENLTDIGDKEQLFGTIAGVLLDFLVAAAAWSKRSLKSSTLGGVLPDLSRGTEETLNSMLENGTSS
jgi:hypothetical protein